MDGLADGGDDNLFGLQIDLRHQINLLVIGVVCGYMCGGTDGGYKYVG